MQKSCFFSLQVFRDLVQVMVFPRFCWISQAGIYENWTMLLKIISALWWKDLKFSLPTRHLIPIIHSTKWWLMFRVQKMSVFRLRIFLQQCRVMWVEFTRQISPNMENSFGWWFKRFRMREDNLLIWTEFSWKLLPDKWRRFRSSYDGKNIRSKIRGKV